MTKTSLPANIPAYGFKEAKSAGEVLTYPAKPLAKTDADVLVTYCGVCATDTHMIDDQLGMSRWPLVPGHEIVGKVINVGSDVTHLKVGDSVCLGCIAQTCLKCDHCKEGDDNLCQDRVFTYFGDTNDETGTHRHFGGFGAYLRTDARKLFHVPRGMEEKYVGPLMCAGVTVFNPIHRLLGDSLDGKNKTIGIMGIGGLGHLALQFASKSGATTVAISRGKKKEEFAKGLGASSLLDSTDDEAIKAAAGTMDQIIVTSYGVFDTKKFLPLLRRGGNLHFCGIQEEPIEVDTMQIMFEYLSITGNPVGGEADTRLMLDFAGKHGVKPIIEEFSHSKAHQAIQKVRDGTIRFRAVLKNDLVDPKLLHEAGVDIGE